MTLSDFVFYVFGSLAVASSLILITRKNPIFAALWMMVVFLSTAMMYLALSSVFLAVVQVLVYAGAILVLIVFVIMLLNLRPSELIGSKQGLVLWGGLSLTLLICLTCIVALSGGLELKTLEKGFGGFSYVASHLFGPNYYLVFELTGLLLLSAVIGALSLTRKKGPLK